MPPIEIEQIDLTERFAVILLQEEEVYEYLDYLSLDFQSKIKHSQSTTASPPEGIKEAWREKICKWMFHIIDSYNYNREVASVALNYLDRYLCKHHVNTKTFQLASMTALFLAIKMNEPNPLPMTTFIKFSNGHFDIKQISAMENSILWTLSWLLNQPTPLCFVRNFMFLLRESGCPSDVSCEIEEVATFLTELSVCDYYFVNRKPSSTSLGAILTALERVSESTLPLHVVNTFFDRVWYITGIDTSSKTVQECKGRLHEISFPDTNFQYHDREDSPPPIHREQVSPKCISNVGESKLSQETRKLSSL